MKHENHKQLFPGQVAGLEMKKLHSCDGWQNYSEVCKLEESIVGMLIS